MICLRTARMIRTPMNDPMAIPMISSVLNEPVVDELDPELVEPVGADPLYVPVIELPPLPVADTPFPTKVLSTVCVKGELAQPHCDIGIVPFQYCEKQYLLLSAVLQDYVVSLKPRRI
jgi:hypothetical protein